MEQALQIAYEDLGEIQVFAQAASPLPPRSFLWKNIVILLDRTLVLLNRIMISSAIWRNT